MAGFGEEEVEVRPLLLPAFGVGLDGDLQPPLPGPPPAFPLADEAVIICTTEERAMVMAETAKVLRLPYARFSAIFAEGTMVYGGEMALTPPDHLPMQPVWVTVGDRDNILALRRILHLGKQGRINLQAFPLKFQEGQPLTEEESQALRTSGTKLLLSLCKGGKKKKPEPGAVG